MKHRGGLALTKTEKKKIDLKKKKKKLKNFLNFNFGKKLHP